MGEPAGPGQLNGQPSRRRSAAGCLSGSARQLHADRSQWNDLPPGGRRCPVKRSVGHEVEITGTPDAQRTGASDDMASNTASSFQVTGAREVGARCDHGSSTGTMGNNSQPMTERPPSTDQQPKGAPGEGAPPQPQPHLIAMLQQPGSTDMGSQSSSSSTNSPSQHRNQSRRTVPWPTRQ